MMEQQHLNAKGSLYPENVEEEVVGESHENGSKHLDLGKETATTGHFHVGVMEEAYPEETEEFDVERVLEKQNTHDLFCPNCHSCITKRVILRRKRRRIPSPPPSPVIPAPTDEPHGPVSPGEHADNIDDIPPNVKDDPAEPDADPDRNRCPEVFACLSCFSCFIPTVNGFRIFNICGDGEPQNVIGPPDVPAAPDQGGIVIPPIILPIVVEDPSTPHAQDTRGWDILKSIVYGGLVESIASLGVVSSAAGGGAGTLNTLALGLANLITGLFVIANNLRELKQSSVDSSGSIVQDRYFEKLGSRDNFCLQATVVIISFIIFGSVAPITYAFSFRESDNRDYKLAVTAAASLFCIIMLAIGKAQVKTPPRSYFKTISYYVITGFAASGVSFLVGELIDYFLEKLGWFDSGSTVTGAIMEMGTTAPGHLTKPAGCANQVYDDTKK